MTNSSQDRPQLQWFRWWIGAVADPKLTTVARRSKQKRAVVVAVWAALLEAAASANSGGRFDAPFDEIAAVLEVKPEQVSAIVAALEDRGLLAKGVIANWDKRQYASDSSTARVRKHRNAAKERSTPEGETLQERSSNTDGTFLKRHETPSETEEIRGDTEEIRERGDARAGAGAFCSSALALADADASDSEGEGEGTGEPRPTHHGDTDHLHGVESGVWQTVIAEVCPSLPRTGNDYCNRREWGLELARCDADENYPYHGDDLVAVLRASNISVRTKPREFLGMLERKYHAQQGERRRGRGRGVAPVTTEEPETNEYGEVIRHV